jgi:hypothetical protein
LDSSFIAIAEFVLVLGIGLALAVWELVSLRRANRRAAAAGRAVDAAVPRE